MKARKDIITCNTEQLNRYMDHEIPADDQALVTTHLKQCPRCQEIVRQNRSIAQLLRTGIQEEVSRVDLTAIETRVLARFDQSTGVLRSRPFRALLSRRFYVPATALVAGLVLFIMFTPFSPSIPAGPSAIVSSLKSDVDAVLIFETPESRQTVIWFHESSGAVPKNEPPAPKDSVGLDIGLYSNHVV